MGRSSFWRWFKLFIFNYAWRVNMVGIRESDVLRERRRLVIVVDLEFA